MLLKYAKSIEELKDVVNNSDAKSYLILGCVSEKVDNFKSNKNIIGALFPKFIFNGKLYDSGFVVLGLDEDIEIKKVDLNKSIIYIISKSGNTLETLLNYYLIKKRIENLNSFKWKIVFITNGGKLKREADKNNYA